MKNKRALIASIFQLAVGIAVAVAFVIVALNGENVTRWLVTLALGIAFIVLGVIGIIDYSSSK